MPMAGVRNPTLDYPPFNALGVDANLVRDGDWREALAH
jgi:hypothetical protein